MKGKVLISTENQFELLIALAKEGMIVIGEGGIGISDGFYLKVQARFEFYINEAGKIPNEYLKATNLGISLIKLDELTIRCLNQAIEDTIDSYNTSLEGKNFFRIFVGIIVANFRQLY